ncbi:MAG: methyltransferase family protein [Sphingomonadales bacterium]
MKLILPPPVQGLITAASIWAIGRWLPEATIAFPAQKAAAGILVGLGFLIELVSVAAFLKAKTTVNPIAPSNASALVASGLYNVSRNPMYLGLLILLSGWALWVGNLLGIIPIALFVIAITHLQIKPEEQALEAKFGDVYRAYKRRVRRWI